MTGRRRIVLLAVLAAFICTFSNDACADGYVVKGTVVNDQSNAVLSGATIEILDGNGTLRSATVTNDDGEFGFAHVPAGPYTLRASKKNFVEAWRIRNNPKDARGFYEIGVSTPEIYIRLAPTATVSGKVKNERGIAVPYAQIVLVGRTLQAERQSKLETTDAEGKYRFEDIWPGNYVLIAIPVMHASEGKNAGKDFLLLPHEDKIDIMKIARGGWTPVGDSSGQPVGYGLARYPEPMIGNSAPTLNLGEGAEMTRINVIFRPHPLYRISGAVGNPKGDFHVGIIGAHGIVNSFPVHQLPDGRFEAWLPNGEYTFSADCCDTADMKGTVAVQVNGQGIDGIVLPH